MGLYNSIYGYFGPTVPSSKTEAENVLKSKMGCSYRWEGIKTFGYRKSTHIYPGKIMTRKANTEKEL